MVLGDPVLNSRKSAALAVLALAALSGCGSSTPVDGSKLPPPASAPQTRYDLANDCYVLKATGNQGYVQRAGTGYAATAADAATAEPFYMKPTALGRYLFHDHDATILTASGNAVGGVASPVEGSDWTIDAVAPGRYTVTSTATGKALGTDAAGKLVMASAAAEFSFEPAAGCTAYPEISTDTIGETFRGRGVNAPVIGFAEVHTHMAMGHEMSDGTEIVGPSAGGVMYGQMFHRFGIPHAMEDCQDWHGPNGIRDPESLVLDFTPLKMHDTKGWPDFADWPASDSQLHQAMYYKWVERAWKAGLRVMVSEGTNINALCELGKTVVLKLGAECNDMKVGVAQVKYLAQLQDYVDAQEGGPGKGWFRIVKDPTEARAVINEGKLAVVPGLEFADLFDCTLHTVAGATGEIHGCTREDIDRQIDEVWDLGVREVFPYHDINSALGGTGIFDGLALNFINFLQTGGFWETYDCPDGGEGETYFYSAGAVMATALPGTGNDPLTSAVLGLLNGPLPLYPAGKRQCNVRGMTELGRYTIEKLMDKGFIIDIDHAELSVKQAMLDIAKSKTPMYPLISAHGGHGGISMQQAREILEIGGLIYPMKPNGKGHADFVQKMKPIWEEMRPGQPLAVGYGMDANGIANRAGPRGAGSEPVQYPFTLFRGEDWGPQFAGFAPLTVNLQTIPQSGKTWNIDEVGTAHYGMVADYVEEVRIEGGREALDALYNSAEAYLQMWEQTINR
jgi:hypothetical protein